MRTCLALFPTLLATGLVTFLSCASYFLRSLLVSYPCRYVEHIAKTLLKFFPALLSYIVWHE
jgi:hypothetical protein